MLVMPSTWHFKIFEPTLPFPFWATANNDRRYFASGTPDPLYLALAPVRANGQVDSLQCTSSQVAGRVKAMKLPRVPFSLCAVQWNETEQGEGGAWAPPSGAVEPRPDPPPHPNCPSVHVHVHPQQSGRRLSKLAFAGDQE